MGQIAHRYPRNPHRYPGASVELSRPKCAFCLRKSPEKACSLCELYVCKPCLKADGRALTCNGCKEMSVCYDCVNSGRLAKATRDGLLSNVCRRCSMSSTVRRINNTPGFNDVARRAPLFEGEDVVDEVVPTTNEVSAEIDRAHDRAERLEAHQRSIVGLALLDPPMPEQRQREIDGVPPVDAPPQHIVPEETPWTSLEAVHRTRTLLSRRDRRFIERAMTSGEEAMLETLAARMIEATTTVVATESNSEEAPSGVPATVVMEFSSWQ